MRELIRSDKILYRAYLFHSNDDLYNGQNQVLDCGISCGVRLADTDDQLLIYLK